MKGIPQDIREIDLMAYADGLLESDTARKNAVEAYLESHPSEAARVEAIMEDNRAIRELYAADLGRPVPQWLLRTVREPARRDQRRSAAIAASVFFTILAAGSGWFVGQQRDVTDVSSELLLAVASQHTKPGTQTSVRMTSSSGGGGALLPDPSKDVLIEVPAPDLSVYGFSLAERSLVTVSGQKMVRLVYRSPSGTMNLFMRLRQSGNSTAMRHIHEGDVSVHYWSEGPLAYALTTDAQASGTQLAQAVRNAVKPGRFIEQPPTTAPGQGESIAADGALGIQQPAEPASSGPQPSQFN